MYQVVFLGEPFYKSIFELRLVQEGITIKQGKEVDKDYPFLYLFFCHSDHNTREFNSELLIQLSKGMSIIPVVENLNKIGEMLPPEIKHINAIVIPDAVSVNKLINYILSYFGLINVNRKIFISYKRTDTQALAMQLYDSLIKCRFHPFLDCYSLDYGVNFQEYLMHELSDTEILLFLNSPNFQMSAYAREELETASKLDVGIVQLKFNNALISKDADLSQVIEMGECKGENAKYEDNKIQEIISEIESFRSQAYQVRRSALIEEMSQKLDISTYKQSINGLLYSPDDGKIFEPLTRIPQSIDLQHLEEKVISDNNLDNKTLKGKYVFFNGLFCQKEVKKHHDWLNNYCDPKIVDVNEYNTK